MGVERSIAEALLAGLQPPPGVSLHPSSYPEIPGVVGSTSDNFTAFYADVHDDEVEVFVAGRETFENAICYLPLAEPGFDLLGAVQAVLDRLGD